MLSSEVLIAFFKRLNALIYGRNIGLTALEKITWTQHIVYRRDKVFMIVASRKVTREGGQEAQCALSLNNQYTEHLTLRQLLMPLGTRGEVCLHLLGCNPTQRVWRIVEWIGKELRLLYALDIGCEAVQHSEYNFMQS